MSEWISVKKRMPEETGRYIVLFENGEITDRNFWSDEPERFVRMTTAGRVTHWMPLPEQPGNQGILVVPDVDAVQVVRCKDCAVLHNKWTGCPKMNGTIMPPDGFCSFGERRADHAAQEEKPHAGTD